MRRFRESGAAAFFVACALLAIAACFDEQPVGVEDGPQYAVEGVDPGSHFRYATLSWAPTGVLGSGEVEFRLIAGFRRSGVFGGGSGGDGLPINGDVFTEVIGATGFDFGDASGNTGTLQFIVTSHSVAEDWVVAEALDPVLGTPGLRHTYSGPGPFTAFINRPSGFPTCCRIGPAGFGGQTGLNNRFGLRYRVETNVFPLTGNSSPVSSMIPVVVVPPSATATFLVPASDPDGDALTWRRSTDAEAGGGPHPTNLSVNSSTGLVMWDNTSLNQTDFWTTQVVITDDEGVKASVDFLLKIQAIIGTLPTCGISPSGPLSTSVGTPVTFTVTGTDPDAGATVTLNSGGLPVGATMTPLLPVTGASGVSSMFDWTPTAGQEGTHVVLFSATDENNQQGLCSITVEVNIVGPGGGTVPVEDDGIVVGTIVVPPGAFDDPVVITATLVAEGDCLVLAESASGNCLQIIIPSGVVINEGFFVTIGLCLDDTAFIPPEFAIFRTDDAGETVVLQNVIVLLDCGPGNGASNLGGNPLTRFARGLWRTITGPFRPQALYATFADIGPGGLTSAFSDFQWAPQLLVEEAEVDDDEIEISGRFDFADDPFNPATENVTITFGECTGPSSCVELVLFGADFEPDDGDFEFESEDGDLEIEVEIHGDGRYEINIEGADIDGVDLSSVSFIIQIGTRLQGVVLEFNEDGECIRANGSGGCEEGDG